MTTFQDRSLQHLARLYGVQSLFWDATGQRQAASREALLAVLQAMGTPLERLHDIPEALRQRRQELWRQVVEPVTVVWDANPHGALLQGTTTPFRPPSPGTTIPYRPPSQGTATTFRPPSQGGLQGVAPVALKLRLPPQASDVPVTGLLTLEGGELRRYTWPSLPTLTTTDIEGIPYRVKQLSLPWDLPWGYHQLTLEIGGETFGSTIIATPGRAYLPPQTDGRRAWGVFLPLYALVTQRSWGSGDFSDLAALMDWVRGLGGDVVGTLPLLASFLDEPLAPGPYAPVSRLFWNDYYVDLTQVPEFHTSPSAQSLVASSAFQGQVAGLRRSPLVDYRMIMALKRKVLEEMAERCFAESSSRLQELRGFVRSNPPLTDYARFRATVERRRASWPAWPTSLRDGLLDPGDYDEKAERYHLYAQWLAERQISTVAAKVEQGGPQLYLDFPLGVHPDGYDVWRERDTFVSGVSAGAPPDDFFPKGQDWGFPPLHPSRVRQQGYRYYRACLAHHLRHAGVLRIDHVMGFHRLFWVPRGFTARQGVYVRYPAREFYAILALESQRHRAVIVGEDLGTVPRPVRPAMARHGLLRMSVAQFDLKPDASAALAPPPPDAIAYLNTHDTPTFAGFWEGLDIGDRRELGLLDEAGVERETVRRRQLRDALTRFMRQQGWAASAELPEVLKAVLAFLAASEARILLVNLEDLWLEPQPQNVPGTGDERPNWRRKARHPLEAFSALPQVLDLLRGVEQRRRR